MKLETLTLLETGPFTGLDENNVMRYEYGDRTALPNSKRLVVEPFEEALKQNVGWDDDNRPAETVEDVVNVGDAAFIVKSVPTTKRPKYETVVDELQRFVGFVMDDYQENGKRVGVKTIDGAPYMAVDDLLGKIDELCTTALEGKEGVSQSISIARMPSKMPDRIVIDPRADYSDVSQSKAGVYVATSGYAERVSDDMCKPFRKALKEELGWSAQNMPDHTMDEFVQIGDLAYPVKTVPKTSTSYAKIVSALNGPLSEKGRAVKSTGDLVRIQNDAPVDFEGYAVRERDGQKYVAIEGVQERLSQLKEDFTGPKIEQKIYPVSPLSF